MTILQTGPGEQPVNVLDLRLGDVITRAPIGGEPVSWRVSADPTLCRCGNVRIRCQMPDGVWLALFFGPRDQVTVQAREMAVSA